MREPLAAQGCDPLLDPRRVREPFAAHVCDPLLDPRRVREPFAAQGCDPLLDLDVCGNLLQYKVVILCWT